MVLNLNPGFEHSQTLVKFNLGPKFNSCPDVPIQNSKLVYNCVTPFTSMEQYQFALGWDTLGKLATRFRSKLCGTGTSLIYHYIACKSISKMIWGFFSVKYIHDSYLPGFGEMDNHAYIYPEPSLNSRLCTGYIFDWGGKAELALCGQSTPYGEERKKGKAADSPSQYSSSTRLLTPFLYSFCIAMQGSPMRVTFTLCRR